MNIRKSTILIIMCFSCSIVQANDLYNSLFLDHNPQSISYSLTDMNGNDWINTQTNLQASPISWPTTQSNLFRDEIAIAWNFTDYFTISFNVFENQILQDFSPTPIRSGFNKFIPIQQPSLDINRKLSGYKLGLSSQLGLWKNYKLGINLNYGQIDGADLVGFNTHEINTTSFELGIRNNRFGASFNTDIFMEDNVDALLNSSFGLELDWHFSKNSTFTLGSKQQINNKARQSNYLDSLTGNVQYIKFQHNL